MKKNGEILVTIGIPTFNRANTFLRKTLESALSQTYQNIEVIVSDNCSTDNTEEIVKSYNDKRIYYYKQNNNIGPWKNMNYCLEKAKGNYFLMLHDDDLIDSTFVEKCLESVEYKKDKGIIIAGGREIDMAENVILEKPNICEGMSAYDFIIQWYNSKIVLFLCLILFNTEKLKKLGGFKEYYRYFADVAAEFEMICKTERVDVPDILGSFRVNIMSFGKKGKIDKWCEDSIKLLDLACSLLNHYNENGYLRKIGLNWSANVLYRDATLFTYNNFDRLYAYYIVCKKFKFKYLPPKKYVYAWLPWTSYFLSPRTTLLKVIKKIKSLYIT